MYRSPLVRGPLQLAPFLRLFSSSPQTPPQTPSPTAAAGRLTFEVGVAFAGKTRRRGEQVPRGMSAFTDKEKVQWRDAMLNEWGPKTTTAGSAGVKKADAGEDFFFVREEREVGVACDSRLGGLPVLISTTTTADDDLGCRRRCRRLGRVGRRPVGLLPGSHVLWLASKRDAPARTGRDPPKGVR